ncbi:polysaccharide deacetylase family protein [Pseudomonas resinovorans]|uniref:Polysaccharide deacetylase family protein n=1 Tax=Metapseudomonas resinovorans TaxID=53412 RepID=A0ABT4YDF6_METRE|nr:polysaccharide deacetylase family protein [Pseudomonas resinovorans]MDA8486793.1 polysaccharide deacetylase family protein [Pseudomonas resinovorans]
MLRRFCRLPLLSFLISYASWGHAAGPVALATIDRATWPQLVSSETEFDIASRAEILMFGKTLLETEALNPAQLRERLGTKSLDEKSVEQVRHRFWSKLLENYRAASKHCGSKPFCLQIESLGEFRQKLEFFSVEPASPYFSWSLASRKFHEAYLNEQLRLAALFPSINSEIARFDDSELNGDELADRQFMLSFDDGPTAPAGNTDKLTNILRENGLHATFFILGSNLQARLNKTSEQEVRKLYEGQCIALHGWEHRSHAKWDDWLHSVSRTSALVKDFSPDSYLPLFRPPYGQRRADAHETLAPQGIAISLWNIDSQDWNRTMSADKAEHRVQTLMLLWRRGTILFHDIHTKAVGAVPNLISTNRLNGVQWIDCHEKLRNSLSSAKKNQAANLELFARNEHEN